MNNWKKRFITIWTGQLFSILSSNIAQFSIVLWISLETASAEVLAYASIAGMLPQILLGPFAGVFVDRWSRKWTMIAADGFVALCSAVMALLFYTDQMEMWSVYLLLMLRSVGGAFHMPAMKSSVPLLAPKSELTRVAGVNQVIQSISSICGPAIGAILIVSFDIAAVMILDVIGAAIACSTLLMVKIPNPEKQEYVNSVMGVFRDMSDGMRAILHNKGLSRLMLAEVSVTFFLMPVVVLLPLMTLDYFGGSAYDVGLVETLFGVGTLVGGIAMGLWNPKSRRSVIVCFSYLLFGIAILSAGLLPKTAFIWYVILSVVQGLTIPLYSAPFTALVQTQIDDLYLGRVFSLLDSVSLLPSVFGILAAGYFADILGVNWVFIIGGAATLFISFVTFGNRSIMNLDK